MTDHIDTMIQGFGLALVLGLLVLIVFTAYSVAIRWEQYAVYVLGTLGFFVLIYGLGIIEKKRDYGKRLESWVM